MSNKIRLTVTIDQDVWDKLVVTNKETLIPKSTLVNKILSEYDYQQLKKP